MNHGNTSESDVADRKPLNSHDEQQHQQQEHDEYEFDNADPVQLKSRTFTSRRRRGVYGKRATRGYGRQRKSSSPTEEIVSGSNTTRQSNKQEDDTPKPFIDIRTRARTASFSSEFRSQNKEISSDSNDSSASTGIHTSTSAINTNENTHPNIISSDALPFSSTATAPLSCFSSLSRTGNGNSASLTSSTKSFQSFSEGNFAASYLSPIRTVESSSRKRGVCDSPIVQLHDDQSSNAGISISRHSTSSYGSRRARSRIFSPGSTKKIMEAALSPDIDICDVGHPLRKKNDESFQESDSEEEEEHSSSMILSTSAHDVDEMGHPEQSFDLDIPLPLNRLKRTASVNSATFENAIFGPFEVNNGKGASAQDHSRVFETMSSYEDLKFLIRELRKYYSGKQMVVFGTMHKACTVVPPKQWNHERKTVFNAWVTSHLGFCLRSGGGMVSYLQTTKAKGQKTLEMLEAAILSYKEGSKTERRKVRKSNNFPPAPMSSIKIMSQTVLTPLLPILKRSSLTTPMLPGIRTSLPRSYFGNMPMSIERSSPSCDVVGNIMHKLESMDIAENENKIHDVSAMNHSANIEYGLTPLPRMVTLPTDDNANVARGRPSLDNSIMNTRDFMSQMHGISPMLNKVEALRPSTLVVSGLKNFNAFSTMSPCVQPVDFECVETPMLKTDSRNWGSRPIAGKDWGESTRCDEAVINVLILKMEERIAFMGKEGAGTGTCESLLLDLTPRVRPEISKIRADSTMLGFDNEVESYNSEQYSSADENDVSDDDLCRENMTSFSALDLNEHMLPSKASKRREKSLAKRTRMSICETAMASPRPFRLSSIHRRGTFALFEKSDRPQIDKLQTLEEVTNPIMYASHATENLDQIDACDDVCSTHKLLLHIFSHLSEYDLLCTASLVSSRWSDVVTDAHASLMLMSVGCSASFAYGDAEQPNSSELEAYDDDYSSLEENHELPTVENNSFVKSMERPWSYLVDKFPWGMFLSEGTFKRVYKVWNSTVGAEEAISVMDINRIDNVHVVGAELSVSVMLSSMARRNICPNFVLVRGVFTSKFEPSISHWGAADNKKPLGAHYDMTKKYPRSRKPSKKECGSFQYIRMELCRHGDVEEYIKRQPGSAIPPNDARSLLFQMAFSMHVAGHKFGMKHYDVKLLNFFLDKTNDDTVDETSHPFTVLRYGLGSHVFNLRMQTSSAVLAKLADFGTANVRAESNGQPVMIGNFTTLENTPADYMIFGDSATQGYGHDNFGLGLCMLHLFTGYAPYEEILETVHCPPNLKKKLRNIWENEKSNGYDVIRSVILGDVFEDEEGNVEGEPDDTLYDTLYRFLVLFGVPKEKSQWKEGSRVWRAIDSCLGSEYASYASNATTRSRRNVTNPSVPIKEGLDFAQYKIDCSKFSILNGENEHIARARKSLERINGGMDLLFSLVSFDPNRRSSPLDVMNSTFMEPLREGERKCESSDTDIVYSYMSYSL